MPGIYQRKRNLLTEAQSSFEQDAASGGWGGAFGTGEVFRSTEQAHSGVASGLVVAHPDAGGNFGVICTPGSLTPGAVYTASVWVWVPPGMPGLQFNIFFQADGTRSTSTGTWERLTVSFAAQAGMPNQLALANTSPCAEGNHWFIDDAGLYAGVDGDAWQEAVPYRRIGGVWVEVPAVYHRVDGAWVPLRGPQPAVPVAADDFAYGVELGWWEATTVSERQGYDVALATDGGDRVWAQELVGADSAAADDFENETYWLEGGDLAGAAEFGGTGQDGATVRLGADLASARESLTSTRYVAAGDRTAGTDTGVSIPPVSQSKTGADTAAAGPEHADLALSLVRDDTATAVDLGLPPTEPDTQDKSGADAAAAAREQTSTRYVGRGDLGGGSELGHVPTTSPISFVAAQVTTLGTPSATSPDPVAPGGIAEGDLLVMFVDRAHDWPLVADPVGWSRVGTGWVDGSGAAAATDVYWRLAPGPVAGQDFADTTAGVSAQGSAPPSIARDGTRSRSGSYSLHVEWAGPGDWDRVEIAFDQVAGRNYRCSMWVWIPEAGVADLTCYVPGYGFGANTATTGQWVELVAAFTATTSGPVSFAVGTGNDAAGTECWIDDMTVVEVPTAPAAAAGETVWALTVLAYRGANPTVPFVAWAGRAQTEPSSTSHLGPTVDNTADGAWAVWHDTHWGIPTPARAVPPPGFMLRTEHDVGLADGNVSGVSADTGEAEARGAHSFSDQTFVATEYAAIWMGYLQPAGPGLEGKSGSDTAAGHEGTPTLSKFTPVGAAVVVTVSDIHCGSGYMHKQQEVRNRAVSYNPDAILQAGDLTYDGTTDQYNNWYNPIWGGEKSIIYPCPGNHDNRASGAGPYQTYFGSGKVGSGGSGHHYSFDLNGWHIISLDMAAGSVDGISGGAQYNWLSSDLSAHSTMPTILFWHKPRFSAEDYYGDLTDEHQQDVWSLCYSQPNKQVEIIINGHCHTLQRWRRMNPSKAADDVNGIREFICAAGGYHYKGAKVAHANCEYWLGLGSSGIDEYNGPYAVLKFVLGADYYTAEFRRSTDGAILGGTVTQPTRMTAVQ